jgi:hypothetical protein
LCAPQRFREATAELAGGGGRAWGACARRDCDARLTGEDRLAMPGGIW